MTAPETFATASKQPLTTGRLEMTRAELLFLASYTAQNCTDLPATRPRLLRRGDLLQHLRVLDRGQRGEGVVAGDLPASMP